MTIMCSQEEVERAVENVLFDKGNDGRSRFGRELDDHLDKRIGRWLLTGGVSFFVFVCGAVGWIVAQESQLAELERRVEDNDNNTRAILTEIRKDISEMRGLLIEAIK